MHRIISFIPLLAISLISNAQISYGGLPFSRLLSMSQDSVPVIDMPALSVNELKTAEVNRYKSMVFAKAFDTEINPGNSGIWKMQTDGTKIWRVGIRSENAYSIILLFHPFYLPEGAKLFVHNSDYSKILGAYNCKNNSGSKTLTIEPLPGEIAYIELILPPGCKKSYSLNLQHVGHGLLKDYDKNRVDILGLGKCHPDVNCSLASDWKDVQNSVFYYIHYNYLEREFKYCNGTLINNTRLNSHPYFFSASHCVWDDKTAESVVAFFNYESRYCDGPELPQTKSISGANFIAAVDNLDFVLCEFRTLPPFLFKPYFAGWNRKDETIKNVVAIHHPADYDNIYPKKVAYDYDELTIATFSDEYDENSHFLVSKWDIGTTENGSSGSPVFDQNKRIAGDLTGGDADCMSPMNDYYTRFSVAWDSYPDKNNQLKYWLDPDNTGLMVLDGLDPYQLFKDSCDTINAVNSTPLLISYNGNNGYWTGHNSDSIRYYAQHFDGNVNNTITAVYFNVAYARPGSDESFIGLMLWADNNGEPGAVISKKKYLISDLKENAVNYLEFDSLVFVKNDFYIGFQVFYQSPSDTFALYQSNAVASEPDNFYLYKNDWQNIRDYTTGTLTGALDIKVVRCDSILSYKKDNPVSGELIFNVYPNPANSFVVLDLQESNHENLELNIYNVSGKLMKKNITPISYQQYNLNITNYLPGIYFLSIKTEKTQKVVKFVVY
ncbi:MAG: T9SS type A sorting domain-containing protein [Bacteroidales bacterium]|nr:T9SS type A sorting domain-containing protein [Bacteroidales bacterium]